VSAHRTRWGALAHDTPAEPGALPLEDVRRALDADKALTSLLASSLVGDAPAAVDELPETLEPATTVTRPRLRASGWVRMDGRVFATSMSNLLTNQAVLNPVASMSWVPTCHQVHSWRRAPMPTARQAPRRAAIGREQRRLFSPVCLTGGPVRGPAVRASADAEAIGDFCA